MIKEKVIRSIMLSSRLEDAGKSIEIALDNIKKFFTQSMQNKLETEANARQLTFALGRTLAGALFLEQAAFDITHIIEGAEEDVIVANKWCGAREFTQTLIPTNADTILDEAKIVFGASAKI